MWISIPSLSAKFALLLLNALLLYDVVQVLAAAIDGPNPTWWACVKSAFHKNATKEFDQIRKSIQRNNPGPTVSKTQCKPADKNSLSLLFEKELLNDKFMNSDPTCRALAEDSFHSNAEIQSKKRFLELYCSMETQIYFSSDFNEGAPSDYETEEGFYNALGVTKNTCPDYKHFSHDMINNCTNPVQQNAWDLNLDQYVEKFCLGYREQRKCYENTIKKYCSGKFRMIAYDRTRVPRFESVCVSGVTAALKSTVHNAILLPTTVALVILSKIISL